MPQRIRLEPHLTDDWLETRYRRARDQVDGRTLFHLATSVSIPLFEAKLEAFARAVGAGPKKQVVLVLDRAGWHSSLRLRVLEHVHLLFLPAYSPELPRSLGQEHGHQGGDCRESRQWWVRAAKGDACRPRAC
jgi:hypothetical protein